MVESPSSPSADTEETLVLAAAASTVGRRPETVRLDLQGGGHGVLETGELQDTRADRVTAIPLIWA